MNFLGVLSEPYPCNTSSRKGIISLIGISLFVFLFLFLFQPFGLDRLDMHHRLLISFGYGLCTALAMGLNIFGVIPLFPNYFKESKWTVGRQIFWISWILMTISLFNTIYSHFADIFSFSILQVVRTTGQVFMVGIFPACALVMLDYMRLYRKHALKAQRLNQPVAIDPEQTQYFFDLISENENQHLRLKLDELLYLTSADNYVSVVYRSNGSTKKTLLRGTLTNFEKMFDHPFVRRCHRSFIVNLAHLITIAGNAQGYTIELRGTDSRIPVSRSYAHEILYQIEQLGN
jgi:hypothetical protein